jgi:RIO kinase 2
VLIVASRLAEIYQSLEEPDFRVLRIIEKGMKNYEYVPIEYIERSSRLPPSRLSKVIKKLSTLKLIKRTLGSIVGYTLTYLGLDILALRGLIVRGVIEKIGDRIGAGKEGDVYIGITPSEERVTIKFHREGSAPFRKIKKTRSFATDLSWGSMIEVAKILGEREYKILVELFNKRAKVPETVAWNRHAVVTKYIDNSIELYKRPELSKDQAEEVLKEVLYTIRIAYKEVGIVHGDLSEYNVLIRLFPEENKVEAYVIDWPQYVYKDEPHAEELLKRDVQYITRFFRKIYTIQVDWTEAVRYVKGEVNELNFR